jgi:hypothetical protein
MIFAEYHKYVTGPLCRLLVAVETDKEYYSLKEN